MLGEMLGVLLETTLHMLSKLRARSQILELGLTGRACGSLVAAPGVGFRGQNLKIKYISCIGTHLWITMPAKSTLPYTKSACVNRSNSYS